MSGGGGAGRPHGSDAAARWSQLYNLYADRLLGFNMFPQSVYDIREFLLCPVLLGPASARVNPFDYRDKVVCGQYRRIRDPVGQQVKNHRSFPIKNLKPDHSS